MATNVEQEEVQAILEAEDTQLASEVGERDFRRPRRLSLEQTNELKSTLEGGLAGFAAELAVYFDPAPTAEVLSVEEAVADDLEDRLEEGFVSAEFTATNQIAWMIFDGVLATRVVGTLLGGTPTEAEATPLSPAETRILSDFLGGAMHKLIEPLGGQLPAIALTSDKREISNWRDAGDAADPYRIVVEIDLTIAGSNTTLVLWLPGGLGPKTGAIASGANEPVPQHLIPIDLTIAVELDGCEIALEDLMSLEVGDVIPIDAKLGEPARITLDGKTIAHGVLGQHEGQLATRVSTTETTSASPTDQNRK